MITKEKLENYASKLMFKMSDEEYTTLLDEFDIILKQMDLIDKIEGISDVEPMTFPFITYENELRKDEDSDNLSINEVLQNTKHELNEQIKVPKVVE